MSGDEAEAKKGAGLRAKVFVFRWKKDGIYVKLMCGKPRSRKSQHIRWWTAPRTCGYCAGMGRRMLHSSLRDTRRIAAGADGVGRNRLIVGSKITWMGSPLFLANCIHDEEPATPS